MEENNLGRKKEPKRGERKRGHHGSVSTLAKFGARSVARPARRRYSLSDGELSIAAGSVPSRISSARSCGQRRTQAGSVARRSRAHSSSPAWRRVRGGQGTSLRFSDTLGCVGNVSVHASRIAYHREGLSLPPDEPRQRSLDAVSQAGRLPFLLLRLDRGAGAIPRRALRVLPHAQSLAPAAAGEQTRSALGVHVVGA